MKYNGRYSIGDMSRICNVSKKALRHYDSIGLISSRRQDGNNYRYYTGESLLAVPVLKYYKQMGFTLEEMKGFIEGRCPHAYRSLRGSFQSKIRELERAQEELRRQHMSIRDWHDLIQEAELVLDNDAREVSVKYVVAQELLYQEQEFADDLKAAIINIDFTNFIESLHNAITGPVILRFPSLESRMRGRVRNFRIMQKTLFPCDSGLLTTLGGGMMLACYHIGPHENLGESYEKMCAWALRHGYTPGPDAYERYVTDYWTTRNSAQFVTEILIPASRRLAGTGAGTGGSDGLAQA